MDITVDVTTYPITVNVGGANSSIGIVIEATVPTSSTDFSMFSGGVAPTSGTYFSFGANTLWIFKALTYTVWKTVDLSQTS